MYVKYVYQTWKSLERNFNLKTLVGLHFFKGYFAELLKFKLLYIEAEKVKASHQTPTLIIKEKLNAYLFYKKYGKSYA